VEDVYKKAGKMVPSDWRNNISALLGKFRNSVRKGGGVEIRCSGGSDPNCAPKTPTSTTGGYTKGGSVIWVCPGGFNNAAYFGGLECVMIHELIHQITGESDELITTGISQCFNGKCSAYGIPAITP
jgi:hypothetical protein